MLYYLIPQMAPTPYYPDALHWACHHILAVCTFSATGGWMEEVFCGRRKFHPPIHFNTVYCNNYFLFLSSTRQDDSNDGMIHGSPRRDPQYSLRDT